MILVTNESKFDQTKFNLKEATGNAIGDDTLEKKIKV